jgi:hypothetical protein
MRLAHLSESVQRAATLDEAWDIVLARALGVTNAHVVMFFEATRKGELGLRRFKGTEVPTESEIAACLGPARAALGAHLERVRAAEASGKPKRHEGTDEGPAVAAVARLVKHGRGIEGPLAVLKRGGGRFTGEEQSLLGSVTDAAVMGIWNRTVDSPAQAPPAPVPLNETLNQ